jgi:predicted DNA-binding protein (MmcQ/YjbR family)
MAEVNFKKCVLNKKRLAVFGFLPDGDGFRWDTELLGGAFKMSVMLSSKGSLATKVIDAASGEEYVLHLVAGAAGSFVGKVRDAYEQTLAEVRAGCFDEAPFTGKSANRLCAYAAERHGDAPEFLWKQFPTDAILRRKDNAKWYAVLMEVPLNKLGLEGEKSVEVVDVRIASDEMADVLDGQRFFPGYHMNKKNWLTILLDGSVPFKEITDRLEKSYALAATHKGK